ncbi:hypothetical protein PG993_010303 [Apiospora rasikravindrae]|uniref:Uncharacterized protein n=1 Tax=Apiospora rasikravindrae TaxID=990691 RepID=A0ABR1SLV1_9PEZI
MSGNDHPKNELYSFARYLLRLDTLDTSSNNPPPPPRRGSNPVELLTFDELLSRHEIVTSANSNDDSQDPQSNKDVVPLPTPRRRLPQSNTMAHWRGNAANPGSPNHSNSLLPENAMESSPHGTLMTGDANNTNNNIATAASDSRPAAAPSDILAYLDGLDDVEPPGDKNMGGSLVYGMRYRNAASAPTGGHRGTDGDNDDDVVMVDDEPVHDCITVSSDSGSQAPSHEGGVHARNATAGNSLNNTILISSDSDHTIVISSDTSSRSTEEGQQSRQGNDGNRGQNHPSSDYKPSSDIASDDAADTVILEDDDETEKEDSPDPTPRQQPQHHYHAEEKQEKSPTPIPMQRRDHSEEQQEGKFYYFATGLHMEKKTMKADFPSSKYICPAKLKGFRWLICGPRRNSPWYFGTAVKDYGQEDPFTNQDPEGYATIAPVYKDMVYDDEDSSKIIGRSNELDREGSCVYGALYEVSEATLQALTTRTLQWDYKPVTVPVIPLERDHTSLEPEYAGSMPLILRDMCGDGPGSPTIVQANTYAVDGTEWHLPWRAPDPNCGGHMEMGRVRDHERAAMIPYMRLYNADWPPVHTPYPLPQFAIDRRDAEPRPLSNDLESRIYREPYMDSLRDMFHKMLFDCETPLWYINEALRPWVDGMAWWPHPHSERECARADAVRSAVRPGRK